MKETEQNGPNGEEALTVREMFAVMGEQLIDMAKIAPIVVILFAALMGPPLAHEQGQLDECASLRRQGFVIPDQPGDPNIGPVVGHDACGDPIYGSDPNAPFGPYGGPFGGF